MTGFGEAERATPAGLLRVELKTVNHRFFNASMRTPYGFDRHEAAIQGWLKEYVSRGHVSVSLSLDTSVTASEEPAPELDLGRARHYRDALERMGRELGLEGGVSVDVLARFRDLFRAPEQSVEPMEVESEDLEALVRGAAESLVAMRDREGASLAADLGGRLDAMAGHLEAVAVSAPERLVRERDRLRAAVEELAGDAGVDEERLAREVAHMADKWDINEEIVRFRSHLTLFREAMAEEDHQPVGKRLGFLVQEMHREANTIGSKANDPEISARSVALKEEIERLREQLENVE
jgi:uncharacterized protein (TIGR00255 family)